jgi:DNA repair protein RadD
VTGAVQVSLGIAAASAPTAIELRPYQVRGLAAVRKHLAAGRKSVLLVAPTGAGKGTIAAHVLASSVSKGRRALFIVHRREIVLDVAKRLRRAGVERVGVLAGDAHEGDADACVWVCSVQTLFARKGVRPLADLIVWDEAHHCVASTYLQVREAYPAATHLLLTATPERSDGTAMGDVAQELVVCTSTKELQELGVLSGCDLVFPPGRQKELSQGPVEAYLEHGKGRRAVFFCQNTHHARTVAEQLLAAGVPAGLVIGTTGQAEREATLERLRAGELLAVVNVFCLTEGWDCPPVEVCVLARGCGSASMFLQCIGRVLRPSPETGKDRALLIDLCGSVHEHGLPDDEREFSLSGSPIKLSKKLPPITTCKACGAAFRPVPKCPRCGLERPPPELPTVAKATLQRGKPIVDEAEKRAFWQEQTLIAQAKGYKNGWVGFRFKEKYGFWPPRRWALQEAS